MLIKILCSDFWFDEFCGDEGVGTVVKIKVGIVVVIYHRPILILLLKVKMLVKKEDYYQIGL